MSANSDSAICALPARPSVLARAQFARGPIQHGVDELVAVGGTEALGKSHRLADGHAERHIGLRGELVQADEQHRSLDWVEVRRRAVGEAGEARLKIAVGVRHALHQRAEIGGIGARHVLGLTALLYQVLPRTAVQLPAVQSLQRQLARHGARAVELAASHRRAMTAAVSSALSIAAPPLLAAR